MCAYSQTYNEPCCGSTLLLVDILRERWGFKGHVMSDCGAIANFHTAQKTTQNSQQSVAKALKTGVNLNCGDSYKNLQLALSEGLITEADIDHNLKQLWRTLFKLGIFDPYGDNPYAKLTGEVVNCEKHVQLAREAAQKSIVLLKNRNNFV